MLGDALSCRASPLKKTIHRIVFLIHPLRSARCKGFRSLRAATRGFTPRPDKPFRKRLDRKLLIFWLNTNSPKFTSLRFPASREQVQEKRLPFGKRFSNIVMKVDMSSSLAEIAGCERGDRAVRSGGRHLTDLFRAAVPRHENSRGLCRAALVGGGIARLVEL